MKIRIIFYKARIGDKHWLDDAISLWTGIFNMGTGPYSHVELWVPGDVIPHGIQFCNPVRCTRKLEPIDYYGTCYTSTMRGDAKGVVKRPASKVLKNPKRWDYCELGVEEEDYNRMIRPADNLIKHGKGYDFRAIASFFWFRRVHEDDKWICSELVYLLLIWCRVFKGEVLCPSPRRLSRWLTKRGYVIKPLA